MKCAICRKEIKEHAVLGVHNDCVEQLQSENDAAKLRIEELEAMWEFECECNKQLVDLQKENEQLEARLENSVELPTVMQVNFKINDRIWWIEKDIMQDMNKTADEQPKPYYKLRDGIIHAIHIGTSSVWYSIVHYGHITNVNGRVFKLEEQAEARLKELKEAKGVER